MAIKITVKNFQRVKESTLIVESFTCLKGKSQNGKSSFLRAISSAFENASGDYFIRYDSDSCEVHINFIEEGFKFIWIKNKGESGYYIINDDFDNPFSKLNGAIPSHIVEFGFSVIETYTGDKKVFYPQICSEQHETLFMVYEPNSTNAEILSDIAETVKYSKALKLGSKKLRELKKKKKEVELDLKSMREKSKSIDAISVGTLYDTIKILKDDIELSCVKHQSLLYCKNIYTDITKFFELISKDLSICSLDLSGQLIIEFYSSNCIKIEKLIKSPLKGFTPLAIDSINSDDLLRLERLSDLIKIYNKPNIGELPDIPNSSSLYNTIDTLALLISLLEIVKKPSIGRLPDYIDDSNILRGVDRLTTFIALIGSKNKLSDFNNINIPSVDKLNFDIPMFESLLALLELKQNINGDIDKINSELDILNAQYTSTVNELKKFAESCPVCGSCISHDHS